MSINSNRKNVMNSLPRITREEAIELSRKGSLNSLSTLMEYYTTTNDKNTRKFVRSALEKTRNKKGVSIVIDQQLPNLSGVERFQVLKIGIVVRRKKYLRDYLETYVECSKGDPKIRLGHALSDPPLVDDEKAIIQTYIIESNQYRQDFLSLCADFDTTDFLDRIMDKIAEGMIDERALKFMADHKEYLDIAQDEIRRTVQVNPNTANTLGAFLNPMEYENQVLFESYKSCMSIWEAIKNNVWECQLIENAKYPLSAVLCIALGQELSDEDRFQISDDINDKTDGITDVESIEGVRLRKFLIELSSSFFEYAEAKLIQLDRQSRVYSDVVLKQLAIIKSKYAFRELSGAILTTEDRTKRFHYAIILLNNYPEKAAFLHSLAKDLDDSVLVARITELASAIPKDQSATIVEQSKYGISILDHNTIVSDLLFQLCKEINATSLYVATGFVFKSGLRMIQPAIDAVLANAGRVELIVGALQNYNTSSAKTKIDKSTVRHIKDLKRDSGVSIYTYQDAFYHGKFYRISNGKESYIIIGSSNISKTAYLDNYEFDTLIHISDIEKVKDVYFEWYQAFRHECEEITILNEELFDDFHWESEQDAYSIDYVRKMSTSEVKNRIAELSDEDTKFRLNTWMDHNPTEIYSELGIIALRGYIVFLFPSNSLAVFESFTPGNAYYTFRYDDFSKLLSQVSGMTKTQMTLLSTFVSRGYHIQNKSRLVDIIAGLFSNQYDDYLFQ